MTNAVERIGKYLKSREVHPMKQLGDGIHVVQVGSEWEAELLLSDLREFHNSHASLVEEVERLREALKTAKETIRAWHGPNAWEIYDRVSPEMRVINEALEKPNA